MIVAAVGLSVVPGEEPQRSYGDFGAHGSGVLPAESDAAARPAVKAQARPRPDTPESGFQPRDGEPQKLVGLEQVRGGAQDLDGLSDPRRQRIARDHLEEVHAAKLQRVVVERAARGVDHVDLDVGDALGGADAGRETDPALVWDVCHRLGVVQDRQRLERCAEQQDLARRSTSLANGEVGP